MSYNFLVKPLATLNLSTCQNLLATFKCENNQTLYQLLEHLSLSCSSSQQSAVYFLQAIFQLTTSQTQPSCSSPCYDLSIPGSTCPRRAGSAPLPDRSRQGAQGPGQGILELVLTILELALSVQDGYPGQASQDGFWFCSDKPFCFFWCCVIQWLLL